MVEYKLKDNYRWAQWHTLNLNNYNTSIDMKVWNWKSYNYRINGTVFTEYNIETQDAFDSYRMWLDLKKNDKTTKFAFSPETLYNTVDKGIELITYNQPKLLNKLNSAFNVSNIETTKLIRSWLGSSFSVLEISNWVKKW